MQWVLHLPRIRCKRRPGLLEMDLANENKPKGIRMLEATTPNPSPPTARVGSEILELNLAYLSMAQRLLADDYSQAIITLGIEPEIANRLSKLTFSEMYQISNCGMLVCKLRFASVQVWEDFSLHFEDPSGRRKEIALLQQASSEVPLAAPSERMLSERRRRIGDRRQSEPRRKHEETGQ